MINDLIQSSFNSRLKAAHPTLIVRSENETVEEGLAVYATTHLLPVPPLQAALGENAPNDHKGVFQITVKTQKGAGWGDGSEIAGAIVATFKRGTKVTQSTHMITIERSYIGPGFYDADKYCLPVSVDYRCFLSNNE